MNHASSRSFSMLWAAAPLLLASSIAMAQQKVVPAQSEIGFTSKQMGVPVDGKFRKWDAQINFDPKKPEAGSVSFTIDTGSASFGSPETDAEVPKAPWFNSAKFPQATFQSSSLKGLGGGKYEVAGKLTIKGSVKDVVVPVSLAAGAGGVTMATGAFTIKRLDFKIGEGEWSDTSMVANDVQVKFKLAVTGMAPL
ncbi:YceI family protein [Ideonella sp. DXS29W]|uniref:YceI family protein n=1 Tax=Ideonella lacteola TaxID=2984193 RepID=A0ABU9BWN1_9BURK